MKPTNASAGQGSHGGGGHHHYSPVEMQNDDVAHELGDVNISALVWSMVVMFGVVAGTAALMWMFFMYLEGQAVARDPKISPLAMPPTAMPATTTASPFFGGAPDPKLMTGEPSYLSQMRTEEQQQLHGYGWIDEKAGVARIPIDEAKKLVAERGLAVRPDPVSDDRLGTRRPASGESSSGRNVTRARAAATPPSTPPPAGTEHKPAEHK